MDEWAFSDMPSQHGKLAVVTGTGGLGYETALALAVAGADVIVAGRNDAKGAEAVRRIRAAAAPTGNVVFEKLDLASLASVRAFVERLADGRHAVDLLVNNAAVMALPARRQTADGFEMQLGTNHLGHFALTAWLLPLLRNAERPRVVTVSSLAHRQGRIDFADIQAEHAYKPWRAYCQSKLANLMFALELQRRSDANGWGLTSVAAHPGWALTDIVANGPGPRSRMALGSRLFSRFFSHSAAAGALPILFAATMPDADAGSYYGPRGFYEMKGPPAPAKIAPRARDAAAAARLWDISEQLTGARYLERAAAA